MMKLLITGANGFIGKSFLNKIIATKEFEVLSLVRSHSSKQLENHEEHICDLNDEKSYLDRINDFKPQIVIHLAWEGIPDFSVQRSIGNLKSALTFFESVFNLKSCTKLLVTGTCWEYNKATGICSEEDICNSKDYFTWAKLTLLDYLRKRTTELDITFGWFRIFYAFGPGQRNASIIPTLIKSVRENTVPDVRNPKNANDFIYVDDISEAFINFIRINGLSGIYNLGSGRTISILDLFKTIEMNLTGASSLSHQLQIRSKDAIKTVDFSADIKKSKELLNWNPGTSIEEAITNTANTIHFSK